MILNDYRKNLTQLRAAAAQILTDHYFERWDTTRLDEAINDAAAEFALRTQLVYDEVPIQILENEYIYNVKAFILAGNNTTPGTYREFGFVTRVGFSGTDEPAHMPSNHTDINFSLIDINQEQGLYANRFHIDLDSPGKIRILPPDADGETLPDETGNLQITYVALPTFLESTSGYLDAMIPPQNQDAIPIGAAAMLLWEGNEADCLLADGLESEFDRLCRKAAAGSFMNMTTYDGARPV